MAMAVSSVRLHRVLARSTHSRPRRGRQLWDYLTPVHEVLRRVPELTPPAEFRDRLAPIMEAETTINNHVYDEDEFADGWHADSRADLASLQLLNSARVPYFFAAFREQTQCVPRSGRFLDVGCGGGIVTFELARRGLQMHGVDLSPKAVAYAQNYARDKGVDNAEFTVGNAYDLSQFAAASFDGAVMSDVLEHLHDLPQAVGQVARVLKPGGVLVFDTINRTVLSYILTIVMAQEVLRVVPPNTHDWRMYIRPEEVSLLLQRHGFECDSAHFVGMKPGIDPVQLLRGRLPLGDFYQAPSTLRVNYLGWARLTAEAAACAA